MSTAVERAEEVLIKHQRRDIGSCLCGWGVKTGDLGRSHPAHQTEMLRDAGLIADGEARTQYGFRCTDECAAIHTRGSLEDARQGAANGPHRVAVRRTAIYGLWQEVSGDDA